MPCSEVREEGLIWTKHSPFSVEKCDLDEKDVKPFSHEAPDNMKGDVPLDDGRAVREWIGSVPISP